MLIKKIFKTASVLLALLFTFAFIPKTAAKAQTSLSNQTDTVNSITVAEVNYFDATIDLIIEISNADTSRFMFYETILKGYGFNVQTDGNNFSAIRYFENYNEYSALLQELSSLPQSAFARAPELLSESFFAQNYRYNLSNVLLYFVDFFSTIEFSEMNYVFYTDRLFYTSNANYFLNENIGGINYKSHTWSFEDYNQLSQSDFYVYRNFILQINFYIIFIVAAVVITAAIVSAIIIKNRKNKAPLNQ